MSFGPIILGTRSYVETSDGVYRLSTLAFGAPDDSLVIRPAVDPKASPARFSISRVLQSDVVENGKTIRKTMTITKSFVVPLAGFTAAVADASSADLDVFLTADTITAIANGRS